MTTPTTPRTSRAGMTPEQLAEHCARLRQLRRDRKKGKAAVEEQAAVEQGEAEAVKAAKAPAPRQSEHLSGLRVTEDLAYCRTEVYCTDCDWTQSGPPGYHLIRAGSIRHHLAKNPGHTIEAKMRGIERFTLAG